MGIVQAGDVVAYQDQAGQSHVAQGVMVMGSVATALASNIALDANSGSAPVSVAGGSYIFDAQFTGTSLMLQSLGADGVTWRNGPMLNASGLTTVVIGAGASVRLYNPNGTGLTGVYASLS